MVWKAYYYDPSLAAAIIFIIAFAATTAVHIWQMQRTRQWFMTAIIVGGVFEVIGYIGRVVSHFQNPNFTLNPYLIQSLFLLVAPPLIAATIYMFLGRIILALDGESYSMIRRKWLTKIFVTGDIISFMIQGAGAGLMAGKTEKSLQNGKSIVLGGLAFQIILFAYFLVAAITFFRRMNKNPTRVAEQPSVRWKLYLYVLFASSSLILIRNVVRIAEFAQGWEGFVNTHEVFIYIFDALLMLASMVIYNIWHPASLLESARAFKVYEEPQSSSTTAEPYEMK